VPRYAVPLVVEAADEKAAYDDLSKAITHPSPWEGPVETRFIGDPVEIEEDEEYDPVQVARLIVGKAKRDFDPVEPAYTVIGVYLDGDDVHQRYATTVYTHNGPEAAEGLAQQACREDNQAEDGEDLIEIVAVLAGEVQVVA